MKSGGIMQYEAYLHPRNGNPTRLIRDEVEVKTSRSPMKSLLPSFLASKSPFGDKDWLQYHFLFLLFLLPFLFLFFSTSVLMALLTLTLPYSSLNL